MKKDIIEQLFAERFAAYQKKAIKLASGFDPRIASFQMHNCRYIGVASYLLRDDLGSFRSFLSESLEIGCLLAEDKKTNPKNDESVGSLTHALLDGISSKDFSKSMILANELSTMEACSEDSSFMVNWAHCLVPILNCEKPSVCQISALKDSVYADGVGGDFAGYFTLTRAVLERDEIGFERGIQQVLIGQRRQARSGEFVSTVHEKLCLWGIAMANLAVSQGMEPSQKWFSEMIPEALIR